MLSNITTMKRPKRWDHPFDPEMRFEQAELMIARPEFSHIDQSRFPAATPLFDIIMNDCRISEYEAGDLIIREGDYGSSAFLVLSGQMRVVINPGLPPKILGRASVQKKSPYSIMKQIWSKNSIPEMRQYNLGSVKALEDTQVNLFNAEGAKQVFDFDSDVPKLKEKYKSATLNEGAIVGEIAALGRVQRTATGYAETKVTLLEIRWQGVRDIRKYDEAWRTMIDKNYRQKMLKVQLEKHPDFSNFDADTLEKIVAATLFETYGEYEWARSYRAEQAKETNIIGSDAEPWVAREGDYADGLLLIGAGFARITSKMGNGHRNLGYLSAGDYFGMSELYTAWKNNKEQHWQVSLSALGYVHVLRIPSSVLHELVFPNLDKPPVAPAEQASKPLAADATLAWAIGERLINGTKTMMINMDLCVRCDDCVRACESGHDGNPRFLRSGKTQGKWMAAHSCMHCVDPVCMIGCPTGAIHRTPEGVVIINDETCIGCETCANSCPYDNIRMVNIRDANGKNLHDPLTGDAIKKATKCDLCASQYGGPACVRACPVGALQRIDIKTSNWLEAE
ncbi:MAG: Fe-S-cluster-containing dehydrogenase component/CRP-like cAMP-binding protein, partial [Chitinophagales bacterium]